MSALDDHLRKMDTCSHLLPDPGGEVVRSCIRAIRVLVEQRDYAMQDYHDEVCATSDCDHVARNLTEKNAAVLAAMDAAALAPKSEDT